ncbi:MULTISPECIES: acyl carrier protein [unclassified Streptomyces]|uniref:acyl carrier protein n=1 Tax=unclassified Streptomyces TaxID=2593676 RepID=UPI0036F6F89B
MSHDTTADPRPEILGFLTQRYPGNDFAYDQDIFKIGFVSSLLATELVVFIEQTFGVSIPGKELRIDNFRTIEAMAALIRRQSGVTA